MKLGLQKNSFGDYILRINGGIEGGDSYLGKEINEDSLRQCLRKIEDHIEAREYERNL